MRNERWVWPLVLVVFMAFQACTEKDPATKVLNERARWSVELVRWFPQEQNVFLAMRVQDPPKASLENLTVQVLFLDEAGEVLEERWETIKVDQLRSGVTQDKSLLIPAPNFDFASIAVMHIKDPDESQRQKIVELSGL